VIAAILCGIGPAFRAARSTTQQTLNDAARGSSRGSSRGRSAHRVHRGLVVAEIALAMVLVISAGLLINSFARLTGTDAGFRGDHIVRLKLDPSFPRGAKRDQFLEALLGQTRALPGVSAVGMINRFPLHDGNLTTQVVVDGAPAPADNQYPESDYRQASPGYFATMGIPFIAGRDFASTDIAGSASPIVAIINRSAALTFFHTLDPIGKRVRFGGTQSPLITVVGVVGDVHDASLKESPHPQVFVSTRQGSATSVSLVVRYSKSPDGVVAGVRRIVSSLAPSLPVYDVQTVEEVLAKASVSERFVTSLLFGFAVLALALAALGTYGVIAYGVAERTREIGVRLALGARASEVQGMVLREGAALFAIAMIIAAGVSWWATRALAGLLFGVTATDPVTLVSAAATMAVATGIACYLPARRASRVDPMIAIRSG
jgi:putative ABC transport system permease protein